MLVVGERMQLVEVKPVEGDYPLRAAGRGQRPLRRPRADRCRARSRAWPGRMRSSPRLSPPSWTRVDYFHAWYGKDEPQNYGEWSNKEFHADQLYSMPLQ